MKVSLTKPYKFETHDLKLDWSEDKAPKYRGEEVIFTYKGKEYLGIL